MTTLENPCRRLGALTDRRTELALLSEQLGGIVAWTQAHPAGRDGVGLGVTREQRLDLARRRDVVVRQRQALLDWTARQLRDSGDVLHTVATTRAVLAHRNAWFRAEVSAALQDGGVAVVADVENGADALGVVVAEQPDLLLLEDRLPMMSGLDLCRAVTRWAPRTVLAVQVGEDRQVGPFLDVGAAAVYTRRTPPREIAAQLAGAAWP